MLNRARAQPERCDVGIYEHAHTGQEDTEHSEEVKRATHVASEIHDGEKVKEALEEAAPAILGRAELTRVVLDRYLRNAISFEIGQDGYVAV